MASGVKRKRQNLDNICLPAVLDFYSCEPQKVANESPINWKRENAVLRPHDPIETPEPPEILKKHSIPAGLPFPLITIPMSTVLNKNKYADMESHQIDVDSLQSLRSFYSDQGLDHQMLNDFNNADKLFQRLFLKTATKLEADQADVLRTVTGTHATTTTKMPVFNFRCRVDFGALRKFFEKLGYIYPIPAGMVQKFVYEGTMYGWKRDRGNCTHFQLKMRQAYQPFQRAILAHMMGIDRTGQSDIHLLGFSVNNFAAMFGGTRLGVFEEVLDKVQNLFCIPFTLLFPKVRHDDPALKACLCISEGKEQNISHFSEEYFMMRKPAHNTGNVSVCCQNCVTDSDKKDLRIVPLYLLPFVMHFLPNPYRAVNDKPETVCQQTVRSLCRETNIVLPRSGDMVQVTNFGTQVDAAVRLLDMAWDHYVLCSQKKMEYLQEENLVVLSSQYLNIKQREQLVQSLKDQKAETKQLKERLLMLETLTHKLAKEHNIEIVPESTKTNRKKKKKKKKVK